MVSIAELEYRYGRTDEDRTVVILAPDATLTLFLDGSSVMETIRSYVITECCWAEEVFAPSFIDFYN